MVRVLTVSVDAVRVVVVGVEIVRVSLVGHLVTVEGEGRGGTLWGAADTRQEGRKAKTSVEVRWGIVRRSWPLTASYLDSTFTGGSLDTGVVVKWVESP